MRDRAAPCRRDDAGAELWPAPSSSRRGWRRGRGRARRAAGRRGSGSAPPRASDRRGWAGLAILDEAGLAVGEGAAAIGGGEHVWRRAASRNPAAPAGAGAGKTSGLADDLGQSLGDQRGAPVQEMGIERPVALRWRAAALRASPMEAIARRTGSRQTLATHAAGRGGPGASTSRPWTASPSPSSRANRRDILGREIAGDPRPSSLRPSLIRARASTAAGAARSA